jgi:hypothetical protein
VRDGEGSVARREAGGLAIGDAVEELIGEGESFGFEGVISLIAAVSCHCLPACRWPVSNVIILLLHAFAKRKT